MEKISSKKLPFVSLIIPTFNSDWSLKECLKAVKCQDYPKERIEILVVDGGSQDKTLQIAKKYNCRIINNPKRLAEPGVNLGLGKACGKICTVLATDNILQGKDWIRKMVKPFADPSIRAAFPIQISSQNDNWLTKYVNTFTDPFNHFVYGLAANSRTFHKVFKTLEKNKDYVVYQYTLKDHPILAFAQGFTVRKNFQRSQKNEFCDVLPVIEMIEKCQKIAYVPTACLYHHTIRGINHFLKKQCWAVDNALLGKLYGLSARETYLSKKRRIKKYLWPIYSLTIIGPLFSTIYGLSVEKKGEWLYHLPINFIASLVAVREFIRIKFLRSKSVLDRQ
jgi:glycosyltransferase involved in cell wall biosynthesis